MTGDKYRVKCDCQISRFKLKQGDILIEFGAYNFETEEYEDGGEYNDLRNNNYEYICDVGSQFSKENLEKMEIK
ncbi:hypothetical protein D7V90_07880 [bacterium 1xD42-87]|nr:hypothetical protein D7V90_07880 [bacterium 1xD42-87]